MNRLNIADRFATMWRKSRNDAGVSQETIAKQLGVSKKTVQNWEDGTSCPNQLTAFEWFYNLGLQPLPYYLSLLYPSEFDGISHESSDEEINTALCTLLKAMPIEQKRKLLYIAYGDHGSSPACVLEMICAHLQTPLQSRVNIAQSIKTNYELAEQQGNLVGKDHIKPNVQLLDLAFDLAKKSVINGRGSYTAALKEKEAEK